MVHAYGAASRPNHFRAQRLHNFQRCKSNRAPRGNKSDNSELQLCNLYIKLDEQHATVLAVLFVRFMCIPWIKLDE